MPNAVGYGQMTGEWVITESMPKTDQPTSSNSPGRLVSQTAALINNAKEGSVLAFNQIVDLYQEDIFRMVYYRTHSKMDSEDITQDVFLKAFKNLSSLKDVNRFKSWLYRIALNRIRDFYRKKRVLNLFKNLNDDDGSVPTDSNSKNTPEVVENLIKKEFWETIGQTTDKLSHMEREVFLLRFFDHLSIKEISHTLKRSESTVKTHLYRSLLKFKNEHSIRQLRDGNGEL